MKACGDEIVESSFASEGYEMKIVSMAAPLGARVEDVDLRNLSRQEITQLQDALLQFGLLHVPKQALTPQEQIQVSSIFGELEDFPPAANQLAAFPQIFRVASRHGDGHVEVGRYWHSDGSFRQIPTTMSIWYLVQKPEEGGETLFTDMQLAAQSLPPEKLEAMKSLETFHRNGVRHPLFMPHPKTGQLALYLNVGLTGGFVGYTPEASAQLIAEFNQHLSRPHAVYAHHWEEGDFVIADNYRVAHRATPISSNQRRILDRTTIRGTGAFWNESQTVQELAFA